MGQKTNPHGFRLGFNKNWSSRWFAKGTEYARLIHEDLKMKRAIKEKYFHAGIAEVAIAKRIVEAHGGSIEVSSPPGGGATFTMRLPK